METITISQAHAIVADFVTGRSLLRYPAIFFSPELKQAAFAVYAYFRKADDLADEGRLTIDQFRAWRAQSLLPAHEQTDPFVMAWADIRQRYELDPVYEKAVMDGLEMDIICHRYQTLDELKGFCHNVASAPLMLAMSIVGFKPGVTFEQAKPYMENMGIAMQLTDIIRDVDADLTFGRIYLPADELAAFGLTYTDIEARRYDDRFKRFMQHFTKIAQDHYTAAWPLLDFFPDSFRLAGGFGLLISRALLNEVKAHAFDIFSTRIKIPRPKIFWLLLTRWPAIYWTKSANQYFR